MRITAHTRANGGHKHDFHEFAWHQVLRVFLCWRSQLNWVDQFSRACRVRGRMTFFLRNWQNQKPAIPVVILLHQCLNVKTARLSDILDWYLLRKQGAQTRPDKITFIIFQNFETS